MENLNLGGPVPPTGGNPPGKPSDWHGDKEEEEVHEEDEKEKEES
jgi:hypothetical protein